MFKRQINNLSEHKNMLVDNTKDSDINTGVSIANCLDKCIKIYWL